MRDAVYNQRYSYAVLALTLVTAAVIAMHPPIAQPHQYHSFSDHRALFEIPNALNVLSNVPFLFVGIWGMCVARKPHSGIATKTERWPYLVLFFGVALTCFGSSWYHSHPNNSTLVWDRLPMAIGFMGLLAATINERTVTGAGTRLLVPFLVLGIVSVMYWHTSESWGHGDLRLYLFVQFGSLMIILTLMAVFLPRYSHSGWTLLALLLYGAAKLLETYDRQIFTATRIVSGHTLKHLAAAAAVALIAAMLKRRHPTRGDAAAASAT